MTHQVVIIGAGMVGARCADDIICSAPDGSICVTLLGAEEYEPYNRVLLSDVLAGRTEVAALTLPLSDRVELHRGQSVTRIDRRTRKVYTQQGLTLSYDSLILATGARAVIPALAGLDPRPAGVHVLRTVDDGRDLIAATANAQDAVVIGGGLLGIEAACGLRARGLDVTLVHHRDYLLDRQLGAIAAQTMLCSAEDLGVRVRLAARTEAVHSEAGRVSAVALASGEVLPADLLLLACGARPDISLAQKCDLATESGVLVTEVGRSITDPQVFAIGDCAQPPQGWTGLVAQGWSQAQTVAQQLVNPEAAPVASLGTEAHRQVVRLKAVGLDVVTLGQSTADAHTVSLHDPAGRRHIQVSVRDGRLVAATCVGAGDIAADLTVAFDRQTPVPLDPAALLLRPLVAAEIPAGTPTTMPATATVCRCNGVTKGQIVQAWEGGACTLAAMADCTRASTGCGSCTPVLEGLIEWLDRSDPDRRPVDIEVSDITGDRALEQR